MSAVAAYEDERERAGGDAALGLEEHGFFVAALVALVVPGLLEGRVVDDFRVDGVEPCGDFLLDSVLVDDAAMSRLFEPKKASAPEAQHSPAVTARQHQRSRAALFPWQPHVAALRAELTVRVA